MNQNEKQTEDSVAVEPENKQTEKVETLKQFQKDETGKFEGLEFLEQERLKSVADLEAMLKMDEKEKPPSQTEKADNKNSL